MSYSSDKGYVAEHALEQMWNDLGRPVHRPRAGAFKDTGDIHGMPLVQSVKNHASLKLADWINGMEQQMLNAGMDVGVVWHKRRGHAHPAGWYVTTTGIIAVELITAWTDAYNTRGES